MNCQTKVSILVLNLFIVCVGQAITFTEDMQIAPDDYTHDESDITVDGCTLTIDGAHSFSNFEIINGGVATHSQGAELEFNITGNMVIEGGTSINLDGNGFLSEGGPGAGLRGSNGGGAGHGGKGGDGSAGGGDDYDRQDDPSMPGSGGGGGRYTTPWGSYYANGGSGGGVVRISVGGELRLDGRISADGTRGQAVHTRTGGMPNLHVYYSGGGGSGGSIKIHAHRLSGNGSITADGGDGGWPTRAGGGAGGRIAISYSELAYDVKGVSAEGGLGEQSGESGTVYGIETGEAIRFLWNSTISAAETEYEGLDIIIDGCTVTINGSHNFKSLAVVNSGMITNSESDRNLSLSISSDMSVESGCSVSVDGVGHDTGGGSGKGASASTNGGGAGHGGKGGNGNGAGGDVYGSAENPSMVGSGGGRGEYRAPWHTYYTNGGSGGGIVQISVGGELRLDGKISADGTKGEAKHTMTGGMPNRHVYYSGGGGSGGSVKIQTHRLSGSGSITASGGDGGWEARAGGGGGGRISVFYDDASGFDLAHLSVSGGTGLEDGEHGTICLNASCHGSFSVNIDTPAHNMQFRAEENVTFTASSAWEQPPVVYTWTSSLDGEIGHGESLGVSTLSVGRHTITLSGEDSIGTTAEVQIIIEITPASLQYMVYVDSTAGGSTDQGGSHTVNHGDTLVIDPTPDTGYRFAGWTGGASGSADPLTVTVTSNMTITANFDRLQYSVVVNSTAGGSTDQDGSHTVNHGDTLVIDPTPDTGYGFTGWSDGASGSADPLTVTVTSNMTITANFGRVDYTVIVNSTAGGSTDQDGSHTVNHGDTLVIDPTPDTGYGFTGWTGDASGSDDPLTVTVTSRMTITASFEQNPPPAVSTYNARGITATSALLRACIVDDGGEDCEGAFVYPSVA